VRGCSSLAPACQASHHADHHAPHFKWAFGVEHNGLVGGVFGAQLDAPVLLVQAFDGVVAFNHGDDDVVVPRLHQQHGRIELRPENPAYQAIVLNAERPLEVWGVVVGVVRRLTRGG